MTSLSSLIVWCLVTEKAKEDETMMGKEKAKRNNDSSQIITVKQETVKLKLQAKLTLLYEVSEGLHTSSMLHCPSLAAQRLTPTKRDQ